MARVAPTEWCCGIHSGASEYISNHCAAPSTQKHVFTSHRVQGYMCTWPPALPVSPDSSSLTYSSPNLNERDAFPCLSSAQSWSNSFSEADSPKRYRRVVHPTLHYLNSDMPRTVVVQFRATGNAPILKQKFYKISAPQQFRTVINFLRKELNYKPQDPLVKLGVS